MKILLVHNDYGKYSGEEAVVDKMAVMLSGLGHEVAQLRMTTAGARETMSGKIRGFVSGIWCPSGVKAMREALDRERPDVVNVHNLYPFISPAALRECQRAGVPVVMTIHNFRLMCPTGLFMRDGHPCELCLKWGNEWGCILHNCEHSALKSIGYAARNAVARLHRHYLDCVDRFACITDFQRHKLIEAGYPEERILVIPNSMDDSERTETSIGDYIAVSGRVSREKGLDLILDVAKQHPEIPFRIAGAVRDKELIETLPNNVRLLGHLNGSDFQTFNAGARFFLMASRCYEGFPMTILDAASYSKPTIGPDHGGFTEIIGSRHDAIGVLFTPGDQKSLESAVLNLWNNTDETIRLGRKARQKLISQYSTEVIAQKWDRLFNDLTSCE